MKNKKPFVSFVICTYNQHELLKKCIDSIMNQNYPKDRMEIICVDGGSTDGTLEMLNVDLPYDEVLVINNKNKFPEGAGYGKYQGYKEVSTKCEFIAFVDQDNELQGTEWLNQMLEPMQKDKRVFGSACKLLVVPNDHVINRYVALIGTDPFAAYRSLDGVLGFHSIDKKLEDYGNWHSYYMNKSNVLVSGGNCFIYRKKMLDNVGGYTVDTDVMFAFAEMNSNNPDQSERSRLLLAIPKGARTWHHAVDSIWEFLKKKAKWGKRYNTHKNLDRKFQWIPSDASGRIKLGWNTFRNLTVVLNLYIMFKGFIRDKEPAWFMHPCMAFLVTAIYGTNYLNSKLFK